MKHNVGFYSFVLTSVVCMLGGTAFAASSVRMLGTNGKTVVGASSDATTGGTVNSGNSSGAVTSRASSVRFSPSVSGSNNTVSQSYSGLMSNSSGPASTNSVVVNPSASPSARLSIGKYLNLSHSTRPVPSTGGGTTQPTIDDDLQDELDELRRQIELLKINKQNTLIVENNEYIDITGPDHNIISIDINLLKNDLTQILGTDKDIITEIDGDYKLWWCYANEAGTACDSERKLVVDLGTILNEYDLAEKNISINQALARKQGLLTEADNGFIELNQEAGTVGVRFNELREALGITSARTTEIRYTQDGKLQWRYVDEFESDGVTKKWNTADIGALLQQSLNNYVQVDVLKNYVKKTEIIGLQGTLTASEDGFLEIVDDEIGIKFNDLRRALNIPDAQVDIEMEITSDGVLRWRYVDAFEQDGTTKRWTDVDISIGDLVDGKLANYVTKNLLNETLENYVTNNKFETELRKYATKTYVDEGLSTKQIKLSEAENGFIALTPVEGGETIGIKFDELKEALGIKNARTSEIRVKDGILQWRYLDEFETDPETGEETTVKKWTDVYDLNVILDDYVTKRDFNLVINRIDNELAGKQIRLTPTDGGYILLNQQTGEIAVDMVELKKYLSIETGNARTSELRVFDGKLQWRYLDEYETDENDNQVEVWHTLDLTAVELPLYVKHSYLTKNYYNKTYIDNLARTIENNINITLNKLALPDGPIDNGLYMLRVSDGESADEKSRVWEPVTIVGADAVGG